MRQYGPRMCIENMKAGKEARWRSRTEARLKPNYLI